MLQATCHLFVNSEESGSGFLVARDQVITAAHVVDAGGLPFIQARFEGESKKYACQVRRVDQEADLALLVLKEPVERSPLSVDANVPDVGSDVMWAGYPQLLGEGSVHRLRLGWGRVASRGYSEGSGCFFEVDGLMNPGHSGGPVVLESTGAVVGAVKASAGSIAPLLAVWQQRAKAVEVLSQLANQMAQGGGFFTTWSPSDPREAAAIYAELTALGLPVDPPKPQADGTHHVSLNASLILPAVSRQLARLAQSLVQTADQSFQMGLGIASGGAALSSLAQG